MFVVYSWKYEILFQFANCKLGPKYMTADIYVCNGRKLKLEVNLTSLSR